MRLKLCKSCNELHDAHNWPHEAEDMRAEPAALEHDDFMMGPKSGVFRKCMCCGGTHEISNWPHNCFEEPPQRSELPAPFVISDTISFHGVQSQIDGKMYDSKSRLRAEYRAHGVTEMGNSKAEPFKKPKPDRRKIKEAVHRAWNAVNNEGATAANFRSRRKPSTAFGSVAK